MNKEKRFSFFSLFSFFLFFSLYLHSYSEEGNIKFNNFNYIKTLAFKKHIYEDDTWKALLHFKDGKFHIKNKEFLLSYKNPSLKLELTKTLKLAISGDKEICKFPARVLWLENKLGFKLKKVECLNFKEFLEKAPADKIYLVFASEDISNPTSMMGHTFFKISGKNQQRRFVEHSISFFAVIDTTNPIKLFYKSFISGMQSFYALQPYKKALYRYLEIEERNLWEFPIEAGEFNKKLLYYHLWELKFAKSKYYFIGYNCATVTLFALALINHALYKEINSKISPRDVIKIAYKYKVIKEGYIVPNDLWLLTLMSSNNSFFENLNIKQNLDNKNWKFLENLVSSKNEKDIFNLKLAEVYGIYLYKKKIYTKQDLIKLLNITTSKTKSYKLQLSNILPVNTPPKSKLILGYEKFYKQDFIKISILPFSHTLGDDNRSFLFESSLKIGYLNILFNKNKILLKELSIYSMKSLIPLSVFLRKPSKNFFFGIKQVFDENLNPHTSLKIDYGMGYTLNLFNDIYIYLTLNLGIGYGRNILFPYFYPEMGVLIYEILNMKSNFIIRYPYNYLGSERFIADITFSHYLYIRKKFNILLSLNYLKSNYNSLINYNLGFRYLF